MIFSLVNSKLFFRQLNPIPIEIASNKDIKNGPPVRFFVTSYFLKLSSPNESAKYLKVFLKDFSSFKRLYSVD